MRSRPDPANAVLGSYSEIWIPGCQWPSMFQVCPQNARHEAVPLPFTNFHPSAHRQKGASVFWTAREWVARGFPPAPPCSERLNTPPVVISWLTIAELLDQHITRHHRPNRNTLFPTDTYGEKLAPSGKILISESTLCWDLSLVLVLTEQRLFPF